MHVHVLSLLGTIIAHNLRLTLLRAIYEILGLGYPIFLLLFHWHTNDPLHLPYSYISILLIQAA